MVFQKKPGTREYYDEVEEMRYRVYYRYLPAAAEFDQWRGKKVLEIGVGIGTDSMQYAKHGALVTGVDLTENAIATTRARFELYGLKGDFQTEDAENLSFPPDTFDLVYCFGVLHHTPNTFKGIEEVRRVLKPGGKAIIMLYARGWKHYLIRIVLNGIIRGDLFHMSLQDCINKNTEVEGNSPLTFVFSRRQIRRMFRNFEQVTLKRYRLGAFFDYRHYGRRMLPAFIREPARWLGLEHLIGENWIIKAVKTQ